MGHPNRIYGLQPDLLQKILYVVFPCWVFLQVVLLIRYWDFPLHDDAEAYASLVRGCIQADTWYPNVSHLYSDYIFAPGYLNLWIAIGKLTGDLSAIKLLNLFLNVTLSLEVYYLARKLFDAQAAKWSLLLYCALYSNGFLVIAPLSDLPFVWCMVSAICAVVYRKGYALAAAGILLAAGNWIRPLAVVFLVPLVVYMRGSHYKLREFLLTGSFLCLTVFVIGKATERRLGFFSFQSTTSGFNLAMSSFEGATGLVNFNFSSAEHFRPFSHERDRLTFQEKDRMLLDRSIGWIQEHPWEYLRQIPLKLILLYSIDTWPERVLPGKGLYGTLPGLKEDPPAFLAWAAGMVLKSFFFYCVLFLFLLYLWTGKKHCLRKENSFLLIPLLGTLATLPFVITERYHYPFVPFLILYGAAALSGRLLKNKKNVPDTQTTSPASMA